MPVAVTSFQTTDPDASREQLNAMYRPQRPLTCSGNRASHEFSIRSLELDGLQVARIKHVMESTRVFAPPVPEFTGMLVVSGAARWSLGKEDQRLRPGDVARTSNDASWHAGWSAVEGVVLRLPFGVLERVAEQHTGLAPGRLRFHSSTPVSASAARQWRTLCGYALRVLDSPDPSPLAGPILRRQLLDLVAATALTVFPNTSLSGDVGHVPAQTTPAALRRALDYIGRQLAEPITAGDIAEAAGVTPRALQLAFRRYRDTTPMAYLRSARLEAAHQDLLAADPADTTVAGTAARWGFGVDSRFAEHYRRRYGVLPSHTLHA